MYLSCLPSTAAQPVANSPSHIVLLSISWLYVFVCVYLFEGSVVYLSVSFLFVSDCISSVYGCLVYVFLSLLSLYVPVSV